MYDQIDLLTKIDINLIVILVLVLVYIHNDYIHDHNIIQYITT